MFRTKVRKSKTAKEGQAVKKLERAEFNLDPQVLIEFLVCAMQCAKRLVFEAFTLYEI